MTIINDIKDYVNTYSGSYLNWEDVVGYFGGEFVLENPLGGTRWDSLVEYVFRFGTEADGYVYVRTTYASGATEYQESDPLSEQLDDLTIVEPYEVTVTKYRPVS